jgi:hypothetical protein
VLTKLGISRKIEYTLEPTELEKTLRRSLYK